ncbi:MAG: hypothetical protein QM650_00890, partial [Microlunatus sp.]
PATVAVLDVGKGGLLAVHDPHDSAVRHAKPDAEPIAEKISASLGEGSSPTTGISLHFAFPAKQI